MIFLDATTKSLEIVLGAVVATNQLPVTASYADLDTVSITPGSSDTASNSTSVVTVVAAPASGKQRQLKFLSVYNADTQDAVVTVQLNNNSTVRKLVSFTLAIGETLLYREKRGWEVTSKWGSVKEFCTRSFYSDYSLIRLKIDPIATTKSAYWANMYTAQGTLTAQSFSANVLYALPIIAGIGTQTINWMSVNVSTGAGNSALGIYSNKMIGDDLNLYPGALLYDSGSFSTATTGTKQVVPLINLNPGQLYWLAFVSDNTPALKGPNPNGAFSSILGVENTLTSQIWGVGVSFTFGALPDPFPAGATDKSNAASGPCLGIGYAFA
jgi:hypothetical protein